jgi:hypothetical protein
MHGGSLAFLDKILFAGHRFCRSGRQSLDPALLRTGSAAIKCFPIRTYVLLKEMAN